MKVITGYHFTGDTLRDGSPIPPIGEWYRVEGEIVPCYFGLHCSEHPFDALRYAPGPMLHRVELRGDLQSHGSPIDTWAGRERRITASIDATDLLNAFARSEALRVIDLWDAPDVVRRFLETGDESIRADAKKTAWAARYDERAAVGYAAMAAGYDAMGAWNAAEHAAMAVGYASMAARYDAREAARERFKSAVEDAFSTQ